MLFTFFYFEAILFFLFFDFSFSTGPFHYFRGLLLIIFCVSFFYYFYAVCPFLGIRKLDTTLQVNILFLSENFLGALDAFFDGY